MDRRQFTLGLLTTSAALPLAVPAIAQRARFFRIGTGGPTGTYYPIGGLIADIVSNPPGSRPCSEGGNCGVEGLIAIAQTSTGSVDNIRAIIDGGLESGFAQADIAYGAFAGGGVFEGEPPASDLRAIANLYPESLHLVAAADSGIERVEDLRGKRVSLDEVGSGTLVDALLLLGSFGLSLSDIQPVNVKPGVAMSLMQSGELDALIIVVGFPSTAVAELITNQDARLIPIDGPNVEKLVESQPFFTQGLIPLAAYSLDADVATLNVGAQWFTSLQQDEELIYELTRALWRDDARNTLDIGHPKAKMIRLETALDGIAVPLHPGAARYYREQGFLSE